MLDELQRKRGDRVLHIVCGEADGLAFSTGLFDAIASRECFI
jgi:hypothetical protein